MSVFALIEAVFTFLIPFSASYFLDSGFDRRKSAVLFGLVFLHLIVGVVLTGLEKRFLFHFQCGFHSKLIQEFFKVNYTDLNQKGAVYYLERISGAVYNYADAVMKTIPAFVKVWVIILVSVGVLWGISPLILALTAAILFIQNMGFRYLNKALARMSVRMQRITAEAFGNLTSVCGSVDYIKQRSGYTGILKLLQKDIRAIHKIHTEVNAFAANACKILNAFVMNVQYAAYIILGVTLWKGELSTSEFVLCIMVINICFTYVSELTGIQVRMRDASASYEFIENELKGAAERSGGQCLERIDEIRFCGADIGYGDNRLVSDVNFTLRKGDIVYLQAETGTGKSSLVKALVGFSAVSGVYINNVPLESINLPDLRGKVSYVSQQSSVINGSLRDNIFLGESEERETEVTRLPFFRKFVKAGRLKDMEISSGGANLSGGDKQKIMLARLFLENPDVLILDEVTSSMDDASTDLVFDEILRKFSDRIILMISHNERVKKYANRHFVIEGKRLNEI